MAKINGDAKVIIERIDNLKEFVKGEFDRNNREHQSVFKILSTNTNNISKNSVYIKVGAGVAVLIIGILIKTIIG